MLTKEEILKDIQKWAKENGGKTPSEEVFCEYAGIKLHNLHKNGWTNYGELVNEAGLTPNKFDKTKYSREQLCEIFIKVVREKDKWPTRSVLDVMHHKDLNYFPESGTFYDRLGKVRDLALTILEYVKDKQGFNDVVDICNSVFKKYEDIDESEKGDIEKGIYGWVYMIKHGNRNEYRIGSTSNLLRRLGENRIELPEGAIPIHSIETADKTGVEAYWLNHFKSKSLNGDWFNLSRSDVNEFKRWKRIF